jgi:hypothetical protein
LIIINGTTTIFHNSVQKLQYLKSPENMKQKEISQSKEGAILMGLLGGSAAMEKSL